MSNIFKSNNNNYRNELNNGVKKINKKLFLLNNESFPDLFSPKNQENIKKDSNTYSQTNNSNNPLLTKILNEQLEQEKELEKERQEQDSKEQNEKHWIILKKGVPYKKQEEQKKEQKEEVVDPRKVFELLTKNYENWKKNYINLWGHDDYEHYYRFPNHDYRLYETSDSNSDLEDY
jgi:hypothetical protein